MPDPAPVAPPSPVAGWSPLADAVRSLLATPYACGLFFAAGSGRSVSGIFPRTGRTDRVEELMRRMDFRPMCRETARQFPGLLSTCDALHACTCPLKALCGAGRVDTIRVESHEVLLGDLMLFADTGAPIDRKVADRVKTIAGAFAESYGDLLGAERSGAGREGPRAA